MGNGESNIVMVHYREESDESLADGRAQAQQALQAASPAIADGLRYGVSTENYANIFDYDEEVAYSSSSADLHSSIAELTTPETDEAIILHEWSTMPLDSYSFDSPLLLTPREDIVYERKADVKVVDSSVQVLEIIDFNPSRSACSGGDKFLVVLSSDLDPMIRTVKVAFGKTLVDGEVIAPCVVRSKVPAIPELQACACPIQVISIEEGMPLTALTEAMFEYVSQPINQDMELSASAGASTNAMTAVASPKSSLSLALPSQIQALAAADQHADKMLTDDSPSFKRQITQTPMKSEIVNDAVMAAVSNDPSGSITWLSDAELGNIHPTELGQVMNKSVTGVIAQLVHYAAHDDDLQAELDILDSSGYSLLHYCCLYDLASLVPVLIGRNVQMNQKSGNGKTALHLAVENASVELVSILLAAGADYTIRDNQGLTALDIGLRNKQREQMYDFCRNHMSLPIEGKSHGVVELMTEEEGDSSAASLSEASTKLLYEAFASFSLADKCALSLSLHSSSVHLATANENSFINSAGDVGKSITPNHSSGKLHLMREDGSPRTSSYHDSQSIDTADIQSVLSETDMESLDVAMSMMGEDERKQVENEVLIIQSNVRAWLLRKNYISLRDSARILQGFWRDKKKQIQTALPASSSSSSGPRKRTITGKIRVSIQQQKRQDRDQSMSNAREFQAAAMLQAATRGMIARKSFARLRRQAMASLVLQKSFLLTASSPSPSIKNASPSFMETVP
jgi:hypothetical protein